MIATQLAFRCRLSRRCLRAAIPHCGGCLPSAQAEGQSRVQDGPQAVEVASVTFRAGEQECRLVKLAEDEDGVDSGCSASNDWEDDEWSDVPPAIANVNEPRRT